MCITIETTTTFLLPLLLVFHLVLHLYEGGNTTSHGSYRVRGALTVYVQRLPFSIKLL
jgi:hypothetical protein